MVIVTKRCFIVADRIDAVFIEESMEEDYALGKDIRRRKLRKREIKRGNKKPIKPNTQVQGPWLRKYDIKIIYIAAAGSGNSRSDGIRECTIGTYDKKVALSLYGEIIKQYREQNPDSLYLDKIAEEFLGGLADDGKDEETY